MYTIGSRFLNGFASLRQRDFRYLILSSLTLGFGQWFQQIGLAWLVLETTGSPAQMGAITFVRGIMFLIASPPAGVLSDRFSRRSVIVWSTAVGVGQALALAVLVGVGLAETWHLYAFAFIEGLAAGVTQPARQAFVYDVTSREMLSNAIAVNSMAQNAARVMGPPLAGVIIGVLGSASVFFILAGIKALAMVLTMVIRTRGDFGSTHKREPVVSSFIDGMRYSFGNRLIFGLLVATTVAPVLVFPYLQFLPVFATDVLRGGPETYGILASAAGWGSLLGLVVLAYVGDVRHKGTIFFVNHFLYLATVLAFAGSQWLALSFVCLFLAGVFSAIMNVIANTLFQLLASNEMRGRVMALHTMSSGLQPAGALPMGIAMERWGAPATTAAFMLIAMVLLLAAFLAFPELRRKNLADMVEDPEVAGRVAAAAKGGKREY